MICKIIQIWSSLADNPPDFLRKHIDRCPGCRRRLQLHSNLAKELSREASSYRRDPQPFLEQKMTRALSRAHVPERRPVFGFRWALASAAGCAGLFAFLLLQKPVPETPEPRLVHSQSQPTADPSFEFLTPIQTVSLEDLSVRLEKPLAAEASALISDARTAAQTFAASFIPSSWSSGDDR